jgi:hypothetical protein
MAEAKQAEQAAPATEQASAAAAPAPSAPEPSGRKILEQAKAELKELSKGPPPVEEKAPEPAAAPTTPDETQAPQPEGSRREQGQRLREQIRREVRAEFEAEQRAADQRQQNEKQQREFDELVAKADGGDWEAKDRVLTILKSNRGMQAAIMQGRSAVLEELGRDISHAIYSLDGLDDDGQQALMKAPSVAEFGKQAFEHGRRIERTIHEGTIATLKAENESLKGRLAGTGPSPVPTNGSAITRASSGRYQSVRDAFAAAAAEHGYRIQG